MQERREGMKDLVDKVDLIASNQVVIKSYIENKFGGSDLAGHSVEGEVPKALRELNEKVAIQNGRVGKLENTRIYWGAWLLGATGVVGMFVSAITLYLTWFKR